jgi:hypothetical protein
MTSAAPQPANKGANTRTGAARLSTPRRYGKITGDLAYYSDSKNS